MERNFFLENGIYCEGEYNNFRLLYKEYVLTPSLSNIAYIPNKLIAVKSGIEVLVYDTKVIKDLNGYLLLPLASFKTYDVPTFLEITIRGITYTIDKNIQIKICEHTKMY